VLIALVTAAVAAAIGVARGGSLERLAATTFVWTPLLFVSLALQLIFLIWDPPLTPGNALLVTLTSIAGVAGFLALNRQHPGTMIAAAGLVLNVIVIAANGAMPVSPTASRIAGIDPRELEDAGIKHEKMTRETVVPWLGDVIPLPRTTLVISIGDVVLAAGLGVLTYRRTRGPEEPRGDLEGATKRAG